jgi:hypothetical protein
MTLILIFIVNFIVFILCLIGVIAAYFERRWKWFVLILICVILSAAGMTMELSQWLIAPPARELPPFVRTPVSPL